MSESNGHVSPFIYDGYTQEATIEPYEGLPEVTIEYRPIVPDEQTRHVKNAKRSKLSTDERAAELMAERISSWDLSAKMSADAEVGVLPITRDVLLGIHPSLFGAMYFVVVHGLSGRVHKCEDGRVRSESFVDAEADVKN